MAITQATYRELFETERDRIFRFLFRLTGNRADAEDLLQESFLAVWRKRAQFEGRGSPAGYLRRTAFRLYLNLRQKTKRRDALAPPPVAPPAQPGPDVAVERDEALSFLLARVREALESLPEATRETFVLFRYEGLTCREIADLTDANIKTVETRLRRATLHLSDRLKAYRNHLPAS